MTKMMRLPLGLVMALAVSHGWAPSPGAGLSFRSPGTGILRCRQGSTRPIRVSNGKSPHEPMHPGKVLGVSMAATQQNVNYMPGGITSNDDRLSFDQLQAVSNRVATLRGRQVNFMRGFYNNKLKCFQHSPMANQRVSISSTSLATMTILKDPKMWTGVAGRASNAEICLPDIRRSLAETNWSMDPFQTSQLVIAMIRLKQPASEPKMRAAISNIMMRTGMSVNIDVDEEMPHTVTACQEWNKVLPGGCSELPGECPEASMYLMYWATLSLFEALQAYDSDGLPYVATEQLEELSMLLDKVSNVAYNVMTRQLAFHYAGDNAKFDVIQLSYALLIHFETSGDLFAAGKMSLGAYCTTGEGMPPLNMKLCEKSLDVIFSEQMENGLWPQGEAIDPQGDRFRGDVGNSFVFSFDLLGSLLETISRGHVELFRQYIPQIHTSLKWAEDNVVESVVSGYCDVDTRQSSGTYIRGWRSNHLKDGGGPVMWCTAHVFLALTQMQVLLSELLNNDILREFGGAHGTEPDASNWRQLLDADLNLQGKPASLKESLEKYLLEPLVSYESRDPLEMMSGLGLGGGDSSVKYSLILYGPPGTAKTTICTSMARRLGWSFLTIDTADFLAEGLANVASRMTYIFDKLKALKRCVILFDEVEEFCLDREDKTLTMESRMLTTAMLTQLNDLRRQQKCVFVVATNRLRSFDAAVTRPGRFDLIFLVGTPALKDRHSRLVKRLQAEGLDGSTVPLFDSESQEIIHRKAVDMLHDLMKDEWEKSIRFLNFAENEAFVDEVLALVRTQRLSRESFQDILSRTMVTCTIQGPVREEYILSQQLSRC